TPPEALANQVHRVTFANPAPSRVRTHSSPTAQMYPIHDARVALGSGIDEAGTADKTILNVDAGKARGANQSTTGSIATAIRAASHTRWRRSAELRRNRSV